MPPKLRKRRVSAEGTGKAAKKARKPAAAPTVLSGTFAALSAPERAKIARMAARLLELEKEMARLSTENAQLAAQLAGAQSSYRSERLASQAIEGRLGEERERYAALAAEFDEVSQRLSQRGPTPPPPATQISRSVQVTPDEAPVRTRRAGVQACPTTTNTAMLATAAVRDATTTPPPQRKPSPRSRPASPDDSTFVLSPSPAKQLGPAPVLSPSGPAVRRTMNAICRDLSLSLDESVAALQRNHRSPAPSDPPLQAFPPTSPPLAVAPTSEEESFVIDDVNEGVSPIRESLTKPARQHSVDAPPSRQFPALSPMASSGLGDSTIDLLSLVREMEDASFDDLEIGY